MAKHEIVINLKQSGYSGEDDTSSLGVKEKTSASKNLQAKSFKWNWNKSFKSNTSALWKKFGKADLKSNIFLRLGTQAMEGAVHLGVELLNRYGEYTGDSVSQANIKNIMSVYNQIQAFASNPFTATIDLALKFNDFNLQKAKDNYEAQYNAFLLNNKGFNGEGNS